MAVAASDSLLEPGLVGILRPVILFPSALLERLRPAEIDAILAHEAAHLKRRDNLTAAIHMVVEVLFWFHPLVWLIGGRLIAERERACDESVLAHGHDAQVYAGGILGVCKFCIASPLACAAGAGGANLSLRVTRIMTGEASHELGRAKQMLLAGAGLAALALPMAAGFPLVVAVHDQVAAARVQAERAIQDSVTAMVDTIAPAPPAHQTRRPAHIRTVHLMPPPVVEAPPLPAPLPAPVPPPVTVTQSADAAPAKVETPAPSLQQAAMALDPRGEGDPDAVTCRVPQWLPGTHLPGPTVCKVNRLWAELRANHAVISPDGRQVELPSTGERRRSLSALSCDYSRTIAGATTSIVGMPQKFCF